MVSQNLVRCFNLRQFVLSENLLLLNFTVRAVRKLALSFHFTSVCAARGLSIVVSFYDILCCYKNWYHFTFGQLVLSENLALLLHFTIVYGDAELLVL